MGPKPWTPRSVILLLDSLHNTHTNGEADENFQRDLAMWMRLSTRPEMEKVWAAIDLVGRDTEFFQGLNLLNIHRRMDAYDKSIKSTKSGYERDLKALAKQAELLSKKLSPFDQSDDENNPFLMRSLLNEDEIDLMKTDARRTIQYGPGLRTRHQSGTEFPSLRVLLQRLARAAVDEAETKNFRVAHPTKTVSHTARRTYFVRTIARTLSIAGVPYSPSIIGTFCSVALDDDGITADLVGALCPANSVPPRFPLPLPTSGQIKSAAELSDEVQRMIQNNCFPPDE